MRNCNMHRILHQMLIAIEGCILAALVALFVVDRLPERREFITASACEFTADLVNADSASASISYGQVYFKTNECSSTRATCAFSFKGTAISNGMIRAVSQYPVTGFTLFLNFKPGLYDPDSIKLTNARVNGKAIELEETHWGRPENGFVSYAYMPRKCFNGYLQETLAFVFAMGLFMFVLTGRMMRKEVI